jgi:hypothetical protein
MVVALPPPVALNLPPVEFSRKLPQLSFAMDPDASTAAVMVNVVVLMAAVTVYKADVELSLGERVKLAGKVLVKLSLAE